MTARILGVMLLAVSAFAQSTVHYTATNANVKYLFATAEPAAPGARLFFYHLPVAVSRHQQESQQPLVQHGTVRQPRQGYKVLCEGKKRLTACPRECRQVWVAMVRSAYKIPIAERKSTGAFPEPTDKT